MEKKNRKHRYAVCIDNEQYPASLESRKIYPVKHDAAAEKRGFLRVIDESGEDYLYPAILFHPITLAPTLEKAVRLVS